ncbi:PolC-type DNA polymerase III [Sinanaerobacter chloroacetimidivorans]|uniref:DNA polymerase III PolC-type n=1 Tax=Sinanaerobacter chloroacetimidivorans TaxID=2818044 RepID=A0A8J7VXV9_9FIRM|nr:PolC-type DNA polymerase III [Sinanaerobacter chloroacetimidivorans]MBR0596764.1 PolC-type DNA polymerase III [Sinanaerobacter chloroacetimidivorans]
MKSLIENTISWNKIGKHPKECYQYSLEKAVVSKETAVLSMDMRLNFVVPYGDVDRICKLIKNEIPGLKGVKIQFIYVDMILSENEIFKLYIEHMIEEINGDYAAITKTIFPQEFDCEGEKLTIMALGDVAVKELNDKVAPLFEKLLYHNFNIHKTVHFANHQDTYKEKTEEIAALALKELEEASKAQKTAASNGNGSQGVQKTNGANPGSNGNGGKWQRRDQKEEPMVGNRIMGKMIKDEPVRISSITVDSGQVTIEGMLFRKEARTIKNNKKLVTILVTDLTTSICVKVFASEEKWNEIDSSLNPGNYVKIRGAAEFDTYENVLVIMGKDIEKTEKPSRQDLCETKRVELHAHTKMSAMDGLNEIKALVKTAAEWGQKAIAITDHGVVQAFPDAQKAVKYGKLDIKLIYGLEGYLFDDSDGGDGKIDYKSKGTYHIILLARTQEGLKNLYKLVSKSHLEYFYKKPRIPKSVLSSYREGLIIGSACEAGEVYRSILHKKSESEIERIADFYDYLEIQPLANNQFLVDNGSVADVNELKEINKKIIALGKKLGKPIVATCDAHYASPEESLYRKILMAGQGYKDIEGDKGLYLRTTEEMLKEFEYLGEELAKEVVIEAPNYIADQIEKVMPVPSGKFPPKIDGAEEKLRNTCMETAWSIYGNPLPELVQKRLDRELDSIINNGYAVMYVSAEMLVQKSLSDGYLVGSRGSVGSSFAATMGGITEVNPLPPHYICPNPACKNSEFILDGSYDCGIDMPEKNCPECGTLYKREGFSIPFEVFLGFEGDKEPDIDLNFAGEYQPFAHKYVEEIFGKENVFRAGTIGTVASKTAYGFVMKYFEERQLPVNKWETERLTECCTGVRRTTGQHPGGIIIVPRGHEIYEFCPVQHPANDMNTDIITTHFDYHSIDENLLKLDILGHDVPSMIRHLQDMTGVDPLTVPLKDEKVDSIFNGIEGLNIKDPDYKFTHGSYGIPEFGTKFVRQMLDDTKPSMFADLVRISGFSHGTDVWINNAQDFIRNGQATMKDAISTRDDIMNYLIHKGVPNKTAFKIMENVRKGKGVTPEEVAIMEDNDVPEWYIESCRRIKYMFPKAHAVAYVTMSYRIAYYKVYHPVEFYAVFFTTKVSEFDSDTILKGPAAVRNKMELIEAKGKNATKKEEDEVTVLEVAYEMYARGYEFLPAEIGKSDATKFQSIDGKVLIPFVALSGVGESAAKSIVTEFEKKPFISVDDMRNRAKVNKTAIEALTNHGVLSGIPESDQLCLF